MAKKISPEQLKKINKVNTATQIADVAVQLAGALAAKTDEKRKQQFLGYLSTLSEDQEKQFFNSIDNAKTEEDRLALVVAVLNNASAKRVEKLSNVLIRQEQENRNKRVEKIILGTILGAMVIVLIYLNRKK
jgi:hypothetical protein